MKTLFLTIIIISVTSTFLYSQEPISFRSQALGGIIQDDLDLIYDPVELRFVKGVRLYTNLSNLTSGQEQILNGMSDNEFLFGASWKYPLTINLWSSALIRYQNSKFSNPITIDSDLDGFEDIYSDGSFNDIYTAYLDTDFNGLYDVRKVISQEKSNFSLRKNNVFILNNSLLLSNWTFGLKFVKGRYNEESTTASGYLGTSHGLLSGSVFGDPSLKLNYNSYEVENNFNDLTWNENGDYLSENENNYTSLNFSVMKPFIFPLTDTLEVRADFGYLKDDSKSNSEDLYSGSYEYFDEDITDYKDYYSEEENYIYKSESKGSRFLANLSLKKVFNKASERKNDGFWKVNFGMERASYDYEMKYNNPFNSMENYFDGADTLMQDYNDERQSNSSSSDKGDEKFKRYFASGRVNIPLGERVYVGLGLSLSSSTRERETDYINSMTGIRDYELLDTLNNNDFQRTENRSLNADRTFEHTHYYFSVPVGIEYKFTKNKKWSLRFGSIFSYSKTIINDAKQITNSSAYEVITKYDDGNEEVDIDDNIYESTSSHKKDAESRTSFFYGLGYNPTDNLQIDLLGFLGTASDLQIVDADFFRSLRLSFSIKL